MRTAHAFALAAALALAACPRPQPSPEYQQARERLQAATARSPLDPYGQPEMDEILALLERVPRDSLDAEAAQALRRRILEERQLQAEQAARRKELLEAAERPTPAPAPLPAGGGPALSAAAAPEAGPVPGLAVGTALSTFQASHGDCFERRGPARVGDRPADAWALRDDPACAQAHPGAAGRLVLFAEGKLLEVRGAAEARTVEVKQKVEGVRMPDGSIAVKGPDGKPVPTPEGAKVVWQQPPADAGARTGEPAQAPPSAAPGATAPAGYGR